MLCFVSLFGTAVVNSVPNSGLVCLVGYGRFFCFSFVFRGVCSVLFPCFWLSVPVQLVAWIDLLQNNMLLPNSLKEPKIILDMADHHASKDGPFRILGNALTYLLLDLFGITFLHFFITDMLTYD